MAGDQGPFKTVIKIKWLPGIRLYHFRGIFSAERLKKTFIDREIC